MNLDAQILDLAKRAQAASRASAQLRTSVKNAWLLRSADRLEAARERILAENRKDMAAAR